MFQQHLFANESVFLSFGRYGVGGDTCIDDTIRDLVWEGLLLDDYHWEGRLDRYRNTVQGHLETAARSGRIPAISNESISMSNVGSCSLNVRLQRLADLFSPDTTCVLLIREQFSWLKSMYSSIVCDAGATLPLQRFLDIQATDPLNALNYTATLDYDWLYKTASRHFNKVVMLPFEAIFSDKGTDTGPISEALGIEPFELPPDKVNASRSPEHIARARALNARFPRGVSKGSEDTPAIPNVFQRPFFGKLWQKPSAVRG